MCAPGFPPDAILLEPDATGFEGPLNFIGHSAARRINFAQLPSPHAARGTSRCSGVMIAVFVKAKMLRNQ